MGVAPGLAPDGADSDDRAATAPRIAYWRERLRAGRSDARGRFEASGDVRRLLADLARLTDRVIAGVWAEGAIHRHCALVAVGGYGRGELYPHSDVDVLILLPEAHAVATAAAGIERLLAALWDVGIELAHAVRSVRECESEMAADATV